MKKTKKGAGSDTIEVRIMPIGGTPSDLVLEEGATVTEALEESGYEGATARVNGEVAENGDVLEDGDRLVISRTKSDKIEAGM